MCGLPYGAWFRGSTKAVLCSTCVHASSWRNGVSSTSSPQEGTCSGDAVMCSGVSTYASGCSRRRSGYESQYCDKFFSQYCAVQWYYDYIDGWTRPKKRLEHNRSRGLVVGLPFVQMLHTRPSATSRSPQHSPNPRATNATWSNIHTSRILPPPQLAPTAVIPWSRMQNET
jgi:hypothetical protein